MFGAAILEPEQISNTCVEGAVGKLMAADELAALLGGEKQQPSKAESALLRSLRQVEQISELDEKFSILDFTLKAKSRSQRDVDHAFFQARHDLAVWANAKEGNALLLEYDLAAEARLERVSFLRQGLPRFYSLSAEAVSAEKRGQLARDAELAFYQFETLAQVKKALMEGAQVEVQQSLKTNGDSASVSWSPQADAWVISSQNVSLLARSEADVRELYPEQSRYFLSRKIALCWLRQVRSIEQLGQARLEALKEELATSVFVGDYLGNPELQSIVKYPRETICFHSVVDKDRTAQTTVYCSAKSKTILKRHFLDVAPSTVLGVFTEYDTLCDALAKLHRQVSNAPIALSEEGTVLTFVKLGGSAPPSVISMCKVKSVEY